MVQLRGIDVVVCAPKTIVDEEVVGAVASTLNAADVPSVKTSPFVRLAVSVTPVPAEDKVTPVIVTEFVPAAIVPVVVPPIVPPPVFANEIAVASVTFPALLLSSCACTVTLNVLPAIGVVGVIEVMASLVGGDVLVKIGRAHV